ncbi:MAG: molybdopterin-dependent oxidoreductase [Deltaproteobacteria bacterium]|nr:molybdopterin-dependent oxidoreductase [Deltaproteobacteria bacterium]
MSRRQHTFCRICEASCGLIATVEDGRVVQLEPNSEHIGTQGFACVKGLNQHHMYDSPDRLRHPLKRIGREWHRVSWEQALAEIGEKVAELRGESPHSLAMYVGTAAGFGVLHPIFAQGFMQGIGSRNIFSSATQDCANRFGSNA